MKSIDEIINEVCFENGYINYGELGGSLRHPTSYAHKELRGIIEKVAKQYSKESERYYTVNEYLEVEIESLEEKVDDLESEIEYLREDLLDRDTRIMELEKLTEKLFTELEELK